MQFKFIWAVAFSIAGVPAASTYSGNEPRLRQNSAPKPAPVPAPKPKIGGGNSEAPNTGLIIQDWLRIQTGNNNLFTRWKPRSHFIAPYGWMNDPCGAVYDPATDLYHLNY